MINRVKYLCRTLVHMYLILASCSFLNVGQYSFHSRSQWFIMFVVFTSKL